MPDITTSHALDRHGPTAPPMHLVVGVACAAVLATAVAGATDVSVVVVVVVVCSIFTAAVAAVVDARTGVVPDACSAVVLVLPLVVAAARSVDRGTAAELGAVGAGALVLAGPLLVVHLISPMAMGFGDVKLAVGLGATLGLLEPRLGLFALFVASGATVVVALVRRRSEVPFAPGLVVGALVAVLGADLISSSLTGGPSPWR